MKRSPATRKDHEKFCVTEGWAARKRATGKKGTHHVNDEFALPDGRMLYTRISHPVDRSDYGASLWSHILRDQLDVSEGEFWLCVTDGNPPDRGQSDQPADSLPAGLVHQLVHTFHLAEAEVKAMTKDEAITKLTELYSQL